MAQKPQRLFVQCPLEGFEVGHSILKNCKHFNSIFLHCHKPFLLPGTDTKMQYLATHVRKNIGFCQARDDYPALEEGRTIEFRTSLSSPCDFCSDFEEKQSTRMCSTQSQYCPEPHNHCHFRWKIKSKTLLETWIYCILDPIQGPEKGLM